MKTQILALLLSAVAIGAAQAQFATTVAGAASHGDKITWPVPATRFAHGDKITWPCPPRS